MEILTPVTLFGAREPFAEPDSGKADTWDEGHEATVIIA
jgi:hypothetical protein